MLDILILGAGYAGLRCALDTATAIERGDLVGRVTLVDRHDYHQVITWLHEVAAASRPAEEARVPLARFFDGRRLTVVQGEVSRITPRARAVQLGDGQIITYDRLVLALGSETFWPAVPGLRDHALPLRWWDDAVALREAVQGSFARAAVERDPQERRRLMTVVVAGGGFTGCQVAGEMAHWLPALADDFALDVRDVTLRLVERGRRLLEGWDIPLSDRAERILRRKGVQVLLDRSLEALDATTMTLSGLAPIPYGVLAWTGGVQPPALLAASGFPVGAQGRIRTDETLRVRGFPDVYVAGDSALWLRRDGSLLPATASHALRQGEYVARCLVRESQGRPLGGYEPTELGLVLSLGGDDAVGSALGVPLSGTPASILKEGIEKWYLGTIGAG